MPRIRTLKPDFFRSPDTAKCSFPVRIFYEALWCWADDFGIGETNINGLLGFAFPDDDLIYDEELRTFRAIAAQDVRRFCADVAQHYGVTFYEVRGRHFYAIPSWEKHQKLEKRTERRKNPLPDDPDAVPDLRFQRRADSAPELPRENRAESGGMCAGTGEQGNRGIQEPPYPPEPEPAPPQPPTKPTGSEKAIARLAAIPGRSVGAYRIAEAFSASLPVPIEDDLLSGIGVQIDKCLKRGIPPPAIATGLKAWTDSDSWSPTQIPNFVHKANNGGGNGKPTAKALGYDTALQELLQEVTTL